MPAPRSLQPPMLVGKIHRATVTAAGHAGPEPGQLPAVAGGYPVEPSGVPFADVRAEAAPGPR